MKNKKLPFPKKVSKAFGSVLQENGYVSFLKILTAMNLLPQNKEDLWRIGKISSLETVMNISPRKFNSILKEMRSIAKRIGLKPSYTKYVNKKSKKKLKFTKSDHVYLELLSSIHYVNLFPFLRKNAFEETFDKILQEQKVNPYGFNNKKKAESRR